MEKKSRGAEALDSHVEWNLDELSLRNLGVRLRRNLLRIALPAVLGAFAGTAYMETVQPTYLVDSTLILETNNREVRNVRNLFTDLDTHANLIRSDKVIGQAVVDHNLAERILPEAENTDEVVHAIKRGLTANRIGETRIMSVAFRSKDPELAVDFVNGIVATYLDMLEKEAAEAPQNSAGENSVLSIAVDSAGLPVLPSSQPQMFDDFRVFSEAKVPVGPASPSRNAILAMFVVMGLAIGFAWAIRREWTRGT
ncbi:MAG: hypothetical protein AAFX07_04065 [Pseudomonadota bacterium]